MKTKRSRKSANIANSRWAAYATAGAATALAGAGSAEATITHITVNQSFNAAPGSTAYGFYSLDPGNALFFLHYQFPAGPLSLYGSAGFVLFAPNASVNGVTSGPYLYASKLAANQNVSTHPLVPATSAFNTLAFAFGFGGSQWLVPGTTGFIGFQFDSGSGLRQGWAQLRLDSGTPLNSFTLIDYAFGDPGEIVKTGQVPEPGSLALLAVGAAGLLAWRRRRSQAAA